MLNAFSPDVTIVGPDDVLGDRETQPGAAPAARAVGLIESLEDAWKIAAGNPHSRVHDRDQRPVSGLQIR